MPGHYLDSNEGPPLRIPIEEFADMVCRFSHHWHDQFKIRRTIQSWDGKALGPDELLQLREWEQKPVDPRDKRRYIPKVVRQAVMERDQGICQACGTDKNPTLDHIKPFSKGGRHTDRNLRVLCQSCNCSKGDRPDEVWGGIDG